jgi:hypothetical protein
MKNWETISKACTATSAALTATSIVVGGWFALYTYQQQASATTELKIKELLQIEYGQKREIYYELVDAAAAFTSSPDLAAAQRNEARYWTIYLGKAHAVVTEPSVVDAKIAFGKAMKDAIAQGHFPSRSDDLKYRTLALSEACRDALVPNAFFGRTGTRKPD